MDIRRALCLLLQEECTEEEMTALAKKLGSLPNEFEEITLLSLIPRCLSAMRMEMVLEKGSFGPGERQEILKKIREEYKTYVQDVLEYERVEGTVLGEVRALADRVLDGGEVSRDKKIAIHRRKGSLREEIKGGEGSTEQIVEYTAIKALEKMGVLQSEIDVLGRMEERQRTISKPHVVKIGPEDMGSMQSLAIGGRISREDVKNLFSRTNKPTMTLDEFAEKIEQRSNLTQRGKEGARKESGTGSSEEEEDASEERMKLIARDEFNDYNRRGDGNVTGRK
jgi:TAP42-like family